MGKKGEIIAIEVQPCDGSEKTQIIGLAITTKGDYDKIKDKIYNSVKLDKGVCFNIINVVDYKPDEIFDKYGLYIYCSACYFSNKVDEFKSNKNISEKFDLTRDQIKTILNGKIPG